MLVPPNNETKNNKQNKNQVPKNILDKEINQLKQLKTAGYLDTKGQDKKKKLYVSTLKNGDKTNNSCRCWAFFKNRS